MTIMKRLLPAFALLLGLASGHALAAERIELTRDDVTAVWRNVNEVVLVVAKNNAMDDAWVEDLRAMTPAPGLAQDDQALAQGMQSFHGKLATLLASAQVTPPGDAYGPAPESELYMRSGRVLDSLVHYLIQVDSLASVAIYYADGSGDGGGAGGRTLADEIDLANRRMDELLKEIGL